VNSASRSISYSEKGVAEYFCDEPCYSADICEMGPFRSGCCVTGRKKVMTVNGELRCIWKKTAKLLSCLSTVGTVTTKTCSRNGQ
jgi:hypothetical protein